MLYKAIKTKSKSLILDVQFNYVKDVFKNKLIKSLRSIRLSPHALKFMLIVWGIPLLINANSPPSPFIIHFYYTQF